MAVQLAHVRPKVETTVETITPAKAAGYLERNQNNRPMSRSALATVVRALNNGHWRLTHQGIAFDADGILLDGQTRLTAIVQTGVTVPMMVTRGLDRDAFTVLDRGKGRTGGDAFAICGEAHYNVISAAARLLWQDILYDGRMDMAFPAESKPDNDDLLALVGEHPRLRDSVARTVNGYVKGMPAASWRAWMHYRMSQKNGVQADTFWTQVRDGAEMPAKHPVMVLRMRFHRMHEQMGRRRPVEIAAPTILAWNVLRSGRLATSAQQLTWQLTKQHPFPLIK